MEKEVKIFLVDDDLYSLTMYQQSLENLGYTDVSLFLNGTICLNNLDKKPRIIFLDHNMEGLTGFEVLRKIKRVDPNIYVIILSAQEDMSIAVESLKYGAFDYIIKGDHELRRMKDALNRIAVIEEEFGNANPNFFRKLLSIF